MVMPDGSVSEGSSSNVWILNNQNQLITRQANENILNGITWRSIQRIVGERQMEIVERCFSVDEMMQAKEVFVTSATSMVTALTHRWQKDRWGKGGTHCFALRLTILTTYGLADNEAVRRSVPAFRGALEVSRWKNHRIFKMYF